MLNNGAKWYNFSPPRWSFIAPPLTSRVLEITVATFSDQAFASVQVYLICCSLLEAFNGT